MATNKTGGAGPAASWAYPLDEVFRARDDLCDVWEHSCGGRRASPALLEELAAHARHRLPEADPAALAESVRHLAGAELTRKALRETAWRLAGNLPRLRRGRAVPPWRAQPFPEYVPAQVTAAEPARGKSGRLTWALAFQALAGTCCPAVLTALWAPRFCAYLAPRLGFTRPRRDGHNPRPFQSPLQLVTLRLELLVEADACRDGRPGFRTVRVTSPALRAWNREQHRHRARAEPGYECPFGQPRALACHLCPVGYRECRAATHRDTYEARPCGSCGDDEAPFDPARDDGPCVNCRTAKALRGPGEAT